MRSKYVLLPPHSGGDVLLFLANRVCIDRSCRELRVPHLFMQHMQRNAVHGRVDPEPVP